VQRQSERLFAFFLRCLQLHLCVGRPA
jgi:hypothetical protein